MFVLFVRSAGHVNIQQGWARGHVSTLFMTEALLGCQFCSSFKKHSDLGILFKAFFVHVTPVSLCI